MARRPLRSDPNLTSAGDVGHTPLRERRRDANLNQAGPAQRSKPVNEYKRTKSALSSLTAGLPERKLKEILRAAAAIVANRGAPLFAVNLWNEREDDDGRTAVKFYSDEYGAAPGMDGPALHRLDLALYHTLSVWVHRQRKKARPIPESLKLIFEDEAISDSVRASLPKNDAGALPLEGQGNPKRKGRTIRP